MKVIDADPTRMIDLPGVGPCPRPVDIDQSVTGFNRLKSLRIYRFAAGPVIEGESEVDEVYIVALDGAARMEIAGAHPLSADLAPGQALYMTPHHAYRLTPLTETLVAYSRAEAEGNVSTHVVAGRAGVGAEHLRMSLVDLAGGERLTTDFTVERLIHVVAGRLRADDGLITATQTLALGIGDTPALVAASNCVVLLVSA